jgi:RNA polymerase sigma-70 factor (ECF subfamily)
VNSSTIQNAIQRLKTGNLDGLIPLIDRYQVRALRTAYLITWDTSLAEDIVQNAFIQLVKRIHRFDTTRPFEPWFLRTVANDTFQLLRRQRLMVSLDDIIPDTQDDITYADLLPDNDDLLPETALEAGELRATVQKALEALPPEQRMAIVMRYYIGLSEEEMAEEVQSPRGTMKWRLHAARQQLRVLLRQLWQTKTIQREGT